MRSMGSSFFTKPATLSTIIFWSGLRSKFMARSSGAGQTKQELGDDVLWDLVAAAVDGGRTRVVEGRRHPLLERRHGAFFVEPCERVRAHHVHGDLEALLHDLGAADLEDRRLGPRCMPELRARERAVV